MNDPDGDFAVNDVLTLSAGSAIDAAQAFGLFAFGAGLPNGSGVVTSAPAGFVVDFESAVMFVDLPEINFAIWLSPSADGLLFDSAAPTIPSLFTNPRTGTVQFFISTPAGFTPGPIDVASRFAWEEGGAVASKFTAPGETFDDTRLRPRGQLTPIPEPNTVTLLALGLIGIRLAERRQR